MIALCGRRARTFEIYLCLVNFGSSSQMVGQLSQQSSMQTQDSAVPSQEAEKIVLFSLVCEQDYAAEVDLIYQMQGSITSECCYSSRSIISIWFTKVEATTCKFCLLASPTCSIGECTCQELFSILASRCKQSWGLDVQNLCIDKMKAIDHALL